MKQWLRLVPIIILVGWATIIIACSENGNNTDGDLDFESEPEPEEEPEVLVCNPLEIRCNPRDDNVVQKCDSAGSGWALWERCGAFRVCQEGVCVNAADSEYGDVEDPVLLQQCITFCDRLPACDADKIYSDEEIQSCLAECADNEIITHYSQAYRCVTEDNCFSFLECMRSLNSDCQRYCERRAACEPSYGLSGQENCRKNCLDYHWLKDLEGAFACGRSEDSCDGFIACIDEAGAYAIDHGE